MVLPATHRFIHIWNEPSCLYSQPQRITAFWPLTFSRPDEGRRLSWPGWFGEIQRWFARPKTVTHSSYSGVLEMKRRPLSRKSDALTTGQRGQLDVCGRCGVVCEV